MLFFSIFLAGFTLGVFATLKIFSPEKPEESWDPQHFPAKYSQISEQKQLKPSSQGYPTEVSFSLPKSD